ncbi:MAG TPA: alpha/beta fold hydrolase [Candidatus Limnocylindria bacterium]|nr:alpha/beta fold hydrolase [Candidatus Limnocylindria bacterium]
MRRLIIVIVGLAVIGALGYTAYVGYEGSRQAVSVDENRSRDCRTPMDQFGWAYEAINYDIADDATLRSANADMTECASQGVKAGNEVVTPDGVHIAGWYVPAGNGMGPEGPTVVLMHGYGGNKSTILGYGVGLHGDFNLVAIDQRNEGRSTGTATTSGVLEQDDLRAIIDWLERTKGPMHIGVLGNSLGAAGAITEARHDPRVEALALDSMHTRLVYQFEQRLSHHGHPSYPGTWAVFIGAWLRTGLNLGDADPADALADLAGRPMLLTHGTADDEDLPYRTAQFARDAEAAGIPVELHWCEGAGHGKVDDLCADDFQRWTHDFFTQNLR